MAAIYNERFEKLLLSLDEAIIDAGRKTKKQIQIEDSEQFESRRTLLVIEELANKQREVEQTAETEYLQRVEAEFHASLIEELKVQFQDTDMIMDKVLKFDLSIGKLLDVLYTESCTISRLVAIIENIPWLSNAILKFVRQPKYRRVDSTGHPIILKTLRNALSFIGIESLRTLVPVLIAKHANPLQSEFTPDLVKHMWQYTIGTSNITQALAPKYQVKQHIALNLGLFSNIGRTVVVNLYLRAFDAKLREEIIAAQEDNRINYAKNLSTLSPSHNYIISLWQKYAAIVTANVMKSLNCRWMMIDAGFEDLAKMRKVSFQHAEELDLHPFAKLLFCSQGFMQYKMLNNDKLMGKQESLEYLRNFGITSNDVSSINKVNLSAINLTVAGVTETDEANQATGT